MPNSNAYYDRFCTFHNAHEITNNNTATHRDIIIWYNVGITIIMWTLKFTINDHPSVTAPATNDYNDLYYNTAIL